ncbi:Gar1 and Med15 domain-containing protein [Phanerochaete sordida]|uniref:H/ACA ribonucleoprotein complex non-core subunit NAF1 n=1 Tax=Phanerochaete sordida TaxID=48140 RepID=A0A9P3LBK6_9APHY|nr:Gar1 and Med15 domain-containing protein [Phanerochaete sordida]
MDFKVPSAIPQDLQIIQDLIGELSPLPESKPAAAEPVLRDNIDASVASSGDDSDADSEREVEENILGQLDSDEDGTPPIKVPGSASDDSASSSDSDSESDEEVPSPTKLPKVEDLAVDDEEDGGGVVSPDQVRTKNEVAEVQIVVPEVERIEEHESMEKVGEVFSIVDKVAIVKGLSQEASGRASDRALDSDTLLVFDDRRVLGYVWETFGPTSQPFYRVQFNDAYPMDTEKVRTGRQVYHVPARSKFVSVSYLKQMFKGSDASNAHDEEPGDDELEFSDDEAEREHKRMAKDRRTGVDPASRQATPLSRDTDMVDDLYGASPYDNPYDDMDLGAGPSRPPPLKYDDPYSDSYGLPDPPVATSSADIRPEPDTHSVQQERAPGRGRGRGKPAGRESFGRERGRGRGRDRPRERGRGRGRGRGGGGGGGDTWGGHQGMNPSADHTARIPRPLSPTSAAIARATGQPAENGAYAGAQQGSNGASGPVDNGWGYQQYPSQMDYGYGYQQSFVQPHINPRFASQFGMSLAYANQMQSMQYAGYSQYGMGYPGGHAPAGEWSGDWSGQNQSTQNGGDVPHQNDGAQ